MLNLVVIWFYIFNLFYRKPQGSRRFRSVLALVQHRWRVLYYRSYLCALPVGFNHSLCPCSWIFVSLLYLQRIQDSRLLYYLIREIKTWLNINHITVHTNLTHIVYFRTQRRVTETTKCPLACGPHPVTDASGPTGREEDTPHFPHSNNRNTTTRNHLPSVIHEQITSVIHEQIPWLDGTFCEKTHHGRQVRLSDSCTLF